MTARRVPVLGGLAAVLVAVALAGCLGPSPLLPILPIGGDFALTDHNGQPFTLASQRGKAVLIFFGYCSCPDVCPTTLAKLSTVSRRMGADRDRVKTIYISVDPARDTPAVLKADLAGFAFDAVGLTGTKAQIDRVVKQYAASYEIIPTPESAGKYTVAHTTTVYGLDTLGRVRKTFPYAASVDDIVKGLRAMLNDRSSGE